MNNKISINKLANLIFPIFTVKSPFDYDDNFKKIYSSIPFDILPLMAAYFDLYKDGEDLDDINLIIDVSKYFENPEYWINEFAKELSNEYSKLSNQIEIDFELGYLIIEYKRKELKYLKSLDQLTIEQLENMRDWILCEKERRKAIEEYKPTPIEIKPYRRKLIQSKK